jgi:hypothetical protein
MLMALGGVLALSLIQLISSDILADESFGKRLASVPKTSHLALGNLQDFCTAKSLHPWTRVDMASCDSHSSPSQRHSRCGQRCLGCLAVLNCLIWW